MITSLQVNLNELTAAKMHSILLEYKNSYENFVTFVDQESNPYKNLYEYILSWHPELKHAIYRLNYETDLLTTFNNFVSLDGKEIKRKYKDYKIKNLNANLPIEFFVQTLIDDIKKNGLHSISIRNIEELCGISSVTIQGILAKYILDTDDQDTGFLTIQSLYWFLNEQIQSSIQSSLNEDELLNNIFQHIIKKQQINLNKTTIIKHALHTQNFVTYCNSFNGIKRDKMRCILGNFQIMTEPGTEHLPLTYQLLMQKINEIGTLHPTFNEDDMINETSKYISLNSIRKETVLTTHEQLLNLYADLPPFSYEEIEALDQFSENDEFHNYYLQSYSPGLFRPAEIEESKQELREYSQEMQEPQEDNLRKRPKI